MDAEAWLQALRSIPLPGLLIALASLLVPVPMTAMGYGHYRGNYHRWPMYIPIAYPPLFTVGGFLLLTIHAPWTVWLYGILAVGLLGMALLGVFFHAQGVGRQTGGFNLDNVLVGPPLFAPLTFALLALLGLLGLAYWSGPP